MAPKISKLLLYLLYQIRTSANAYNEILNAKRPVNTEFALLIEAALGVNPETLMNMQMRYNMQMARADKTLTERFKQIRKLSAIL